jgi:hypothetical protein
MLRRDVSLFVGQWNGKDFAYSLDEAGAKHLVESHWAFGDPSEDEYTVGKSWASAEGEQGWRIVARTVAVTEVGVGVDSDEDGSPRHVHWQCPYCHKRYSDEWLADDRLPVLLGCGCQEASRCVLGTRFVGPEQWPSS